MTKRNIHVSLRRGNINDAEAVLELQKEVLSEGEFMISVMEEYEETQEKIKSWIEKILSWAEHTPFIEKVSLGVLSTNLRAIQLYKSMGFVEEGRKIKEVKFSDDLYIDDLLMYKLV